MLFWLGTCSKCTVVKILCKAKEKGSEEHPFVELNVAEVENLVILENLMIKNNNS